MNTLLEGHALRFLRALHQRVNYIVPGAETASVASVVRLVEGAFRLYAAEFRDPLEIALWDWPFQELTRDHPFETGTEPWVILLREAYRLALGSHVLLKCRGQMPGDMTSELILKVDRMILEAAKDELLWGVGTKGQDPDAWKAELRKRLWKELKVTWEVLHGLTLLDVFRTNRYWPR